MNKKRFEIYKNRLILLAKKANEPDVPGKRDRVVFSKNTGFSLIDDVLDEYNCLIKDLLKENKWGEKFSEKYIREKIDHIIGKAFSCEEKEEVVENFFKSLVDDLYNYDCEFTVIIPLSGLDLNVDNINLGRACLYKLTDEKLKNLTDKITNIILYSKNTDKEKQILIQNEINFLESIKNKVCCEYQLLAEPERAWERAIEENFRILDILKYAIYSIWHNRHRFNISIFSTSSANSTSFFSIMSTDFCFYSSREHLNDTTLTFNINSNNLRKMGEAGLFKLSDILSKPIEKLTGFERVLLRSIHWFSSTIDQYENENKILNMITCLETLLTPKDREPIANAVAEGVAFFVANGFKNRKYIKNRIKKLYTLRSAISHGGEKQVFETDVIHLKEISKYLLETLINRKDEFKTQADLLEWIEKQKLS